MWPFLWLVTLNLFLVAAEDCSPYTNTDCSLCTENDECYWCESSNECKYWGYGDLPHIKCKGQNYYFRQCNVNGLGFILIFSLALLLILFAIVCCCCVCACCCYCCIRRRRRREYTLLESPRDSQEQEIRPQIRVNSDVTVQQQT